MKHAGVKQIDVVTAVLRPRQQDSVCKSRGWRFGCSLNISRPSCFWDRLLARRPSRRGSQSPAPDVRQQVCVCMFTDVHVHPVAVKEASRAEREHGPSARVVLMKSPDEQRGFS